jgi:hypothetical protein
MPKSARKPKDNQTPTKPGAATHVSSGLALHDATDAAIAADHKHKAEEDDFAPPTASQRKTGVNIVKVVEAILATPYIDAAYLVLGRLPMHDIGAVAAPLRERLAGLSA